MWKRLFIALGVLALWSSAAQAQAQGEGDSKFLLRGYYHAGLNLREDGGTFVAGDFAPIFLWKQSDRLLFEGELLFQLEAEQTNLDIEYTNMSYRLAEGARLQLGKFILPYGIFAERMHPNWINKFPTMPLGFMHGGILPFSDLGAGLRGGFPVGNLKFAYAFYVTNGPRLNDGSEEPDEAGMLHYENFIDNNKSKSVGGRLGFLPISDSSLELGISGLFGLVGNSDSPYEGVGAQIYSADLTYVKRFDFIKSFVNLTGQWNLVNVDDTEYPDPEDSTGVGTFTFDNSSETYFVQLSLRPAYVDNPFLRHVELAGRYSYLKTPEGAPWETKQKQWAIGLNYWLDWRTVLKVSYQHLDVVGGQDEADEPEGHRGTVPEGGTVFVHWAMGF